MNHLEKKKYLRRCIFRLGLVRVKSAPLMPVMENALREWEIPLYIYKLKIKGIFKVQLYV